MIEKEQVVVVIPYFHTDLSVTEQISLKQCEEILGNYDIVLVVPEKLKYSELPLHEIQFVPNEWLDNIDSYNRMMISADFYGRFYKYEYMLVYQLDALVFSDKLIDFCNMGYDYIGAPWLSGRRKIHNYKRSYFYVGNGGFSLRRIRTFYNLSYVERVSDISIPEDLFWAYHKSEYFKVPDIEIANSFAMEEQISRSIKMNKGELPFGCHAWYKFNLDCLKPYLQDFNIDVSNVISPHLDSDIGWNHKDLFDATEQDLKTVMNVPNDENIEIIICGTGLFGEEAYALFKTIEVEKFRFADNDAAKCGIPFFDKKIELLSNLLSDYHKERIFVIAMGNKYRSIVKEQLEEHGYVFNKNVFYFQYLREKLEERMQSEWFWDDNVSIKVDEIGK